MGIRAGNKEIVAINWGRKAISAIYCGAKLIWQSVRSCFGSGLWVSEKPWIGEEEWKSNK